MAARECHMPVPSKHIVKASPTAVHKSCFLAGEPHNLTPCPIGIDTKRIPRYRKSSGDILIRKV